VSWAGGASQAPATIRPAGQGADPAGGAGTGGAGAGGSGAGRGQDRHGAGNWLSVVRTASGGMLRHKVQAVVIVAVLFIATASATLGLALLNANNSPFTRAFAAQHGSDVTVTVNPGRASAAQLAALGEEMLQWTLVFQAPAAGRARARVPARPTPDLFPQLASSKDGGG